MMLGYNETKRTNYFHFEELRLWLKRQWISQETFEILSAKITPRYKHSNIFINIGLFVLTSVIISSAIGFAALFYFSFLEADVFWFPCLITGIVLLFILQLIVIDKKHQFRTGADDATLYFALCFLLAFFFIVYESTLLEEELILSLFLVIFFALPAYIYLDRLLTALSFLSFIAFIFIAPFKMSNQFALFIPFIFMIISGLGYKITYRLIQAAKSVATEQCLEVIHWICLALFYLSGNYFVVIEMSSELGLSNEFPLVVQWFLYGFTILVPLFYIYFGITLKRLNLINMGLLVVVLSILTLRHYFSSLSIESELIIAGIIFIGIAWLALKHWAQDKNGITLTPDSAMDDHLKIESLIIDQTFSDSSSQETFGGQGGQFGGGGSTGAF